MPDDLTQLMLTVYLQLLILLSELFSLAQRESFTAVLDYKPLNVQVVLRSASSPKA